MDVHPIKNGIDRYWSIPICEVDGNGGIHWLGLERGPSQLQHQPGGVGVDPNETLYTINIYIYIHNYKIREKLYIIWEDSNNVFKVTWVVTCGSATLRSWAAITFLLEKENMKRQRSWSLRPNLVQNIHGKWFSPKQNKQNCKCAPYNLVWNPCLLLYPMWIS